MLILNIHIYYFRIMADEYIKEFLSFTAIDKKRRSAILSCQICEIQIKGRRLENMVKCKCNIIVFCCYFCRSKSQHFKKCSSNEEVHINPFIEDKDRLPVEIRKINIELNPQIFYKVQEHEEAFYRELLSEEPIFKDLKYKFNNKNKHDLRELDSDPWFCTALGLGLVKPAPFIQIPKEFEKRHQFEKVDMAIKYLRCGAAYGITVAEYMAGRLIIEYHGFEFLELDLRDGLDFLARVIHKRSNDHRAAMIYKQKSNFFSQIIDVKRKIKETLLNTNKASITKPDEKNSKIMYINLDGTTGIGSYIYSKCIDCINILSSQQLKCYFDSQCLTLFSDDLLSVHQYFEHMTKKLFPYTKGIIKLNINPYHWETDNGVENKHSIRYIDSPNFNKEEAFNDLLKVNEGLESLSNTSFTQYICQHPHTNLKHGGICETCLQTGKDRILAVASQGYAISLNYVTKIQGTLVYGVIFQSDENKIEYETFIPYAKQDINSIVRLLSFHSADIDPRLISLEKNIYWSIIWYFGSISNGLKVIGGNNLYNKAFSQRRNISQKTTTVHGLKHKLIKENFITNMTTVRKWRYSCKSTTCNNLEDIGNFKSCGACKSSIAIKYCSIECQKNDWNHHKPNCKLTLNNIKRKGKKQK